ncbi:MAG TPA: dihydropteroate synthase [Chloroflexia bacterium]|nr:dihydropteroate synthase [Chloroflexia bacterium]
MQDTGREILSAKSGFLVLRLERVPCIAANVLKQEILARGGDCAVHRDCVTLDAEHSGALLMGTRAQVGDLVEKLQAQDFGLPDVADEISALLSNIDRRPSPVALRGHTLPIGERTLVMGIVNVTPDSFSGDGLGDDAAAAVEQARRMVEEGADIVDVGGQSTRPGSEPVSPEEEIRRVIPVIERLSRDARLPAAISIDTNRAEVARAALEAGAHIVNDISGLRDDPAIAQAVAAHGAGLVVMHIQGTPQTMQKNPHYDDLLGEVIGYLRRSMRVAEMAGIPRERVWVDPGIGFGKSMEHNLELLNRLDELRSLGCAILVGTSRKSFIGRLLAPLYGGDAPAPAERVTGSGATVALSIARGASVVRVHDVRHTVEVARIADAIVRS